MSANINPIFLLTPHESWALTSTSAVTSTDGTDANVKTVFTAAANGSMIYEVAIAATTNTSATVVRFWINNGGSAGTAANNTLYHEETFPTQTLSTTAANLVILWRPNLVLAANYVLRVACTVATNALAVTGNGGDY